MARLGKFGLRLAISVGLTALLVWLALAPDGIARRFATLEKLYQSGQLTKAGSSEVTEFRVDALAALDAADIEGPVVINGPPQPGRFHLYITDPESAWFTNCARGNAVYDSDLDVLYVDRALWKPLELSLVGESWPWTANGPRQFGFTHTFLSLVLLHEIGHRQLHRSQSNLFDAVPGNRGRQREIEADTFAVNAIRSGYLRGIFGKNRVVLDELIEAGINPKLDRERLATAAILYAVSQMSIGLLFSKGSFSSLYADAAHPSFGQRVEFMAQALSVVTKNDPDPQLGAYLEYFRQVASTMENVRQSNFVEIQTETPVEAAEFDEDGLTLLDTSWQAWHVKTSEFDRASPNNAIKPRLIGTLPTKDPHAYVSSAWSVPHLGVFITNFRGDAFQINGNALTARPDLATALGNSAISVVIPTPQPSNLSVHFGTTLSVMNLDHVVMGVDYKLLFSVASPGNMMYDERISDSTVLDGTLHVPVYRHLGPLAGCFEIDTRHPSAGSFKKFELSDNFDGFGTLVAVSGTDPVRHFMVGKDSSNLVISELFENMPPRLRATHQTFASHLSSAASSVLHLQLEPYVTKVRFLPPNTVLIALTGDSIYRFDARSDDLDVAFHPGTNVNILLGAHGVFGLYSVNGYKTYVGRIPRN